MNSIVAYCMADLRIGNTGPGTWQGQPVGTGAALQPPQPAAQPVSSVRGVSPTGQRLASYEQAMALLVIAPTFCSRAIATAQKATMPAAPAIIDVAAKAVLPLPIASAVSPRLARATEGAPEKRPASVFGFNRSLSIENATTRQPPAIALAAIMRVGAMTPYAPA